MRFGLNYIPSKKWLYSWLDFDEASIKQDLLKIKELGFDHIRAHLIWSYFQPNESYISQHCLDNLKKFVALCNEVDIDFFLTLFTGWMSGFVFLPSWLNVGGFDVWKLGMFTDEKAIKAEMLYIEKVAEVVSDSENFLGFDLGNELNCLLRKDIDKNLTNENADKWSNIMFEECNRVLPGRLHSNGMAHSPWFGEIFISRKTLANDGAITPVHAWAPFTGTTGKYGWNSKETYRLPNYMIEMAKAYCDNPQRKYWIQEFGMADQWFKNESELKAFITNTLYECASDKQVWGITWWCSHDISDEYKGFVDFEHNLGVIDVNNNAKPAGLIFKDFIRSFNENDINEIKPHKALVIKKGSGNENDYTNALPYMNCIKEGIYPAFVTEEKSKDIKHLKERGITEIIK